MNAAPGPSPADTVVSSDRAAEAKRAAMLRFADDLAALYADLWINGKLDEILKESTDAASEDE
ncbi:MAG: hypothetical protein KF795_00110 [Labilithrix sp.]|nr:hypothetical protein [Labilithrix sp.]